MTAITITRMSRHLRTCVALIVGAWASIAAASDTPTFKIYLREPGVYRITFKELRAAGLEEKLIEANSLCLRNLGQPVPIWIPPSWDGLFGPDNYFEFVGEHLAGENNFYHEYSDLNVYVLSWDGGGSRMDAVPASVVPSGDASSPVLKDRLVVREHLEKDKLFMRFAGGETKGPPADLWHWAKLTHQDKERFKLKLDLSARSLDGELPVGLRICLRGWSKPAKKFFPTMADHRVEVYVNGQMMGFGEWNRQKSTTIEIPDISSAIFNARAVLKLKIPKRRPSDYAEAVEPSGPEAATEPDAATDESAASPQIRDDPLIDVVMLNWIEITYPRINNIGSRQIRTCLNEANGDPVQLVAGSNNQVTVFTPQGTRIALGGRRSAGLVTYSFLLPEGQDTMYVVPEGSFLSPDAIKIDTPSNLREISQQADYIIITHPRLREAIQPLVDFHRNRGLTVTLVDIQDVYDEFNFGILHPRPIRDFLHYAFLNWQAPAARYVLLVGDASWDTKNPKDGDNIYADWTYRPGESRNFVRNLSTPYAATTDLEHRNLIPTSLYLGFEGHSASDNWFVAFPSEEDEAAEAPLNPRLARAQRALPDMAIGRFTVTEPEEVAAIVEKSIAYGQAEAGPWRRNILWVTSEQDSWQLRSDRLAAPMAGRGFSNSRVYPSSKETTNERHQGLLQEALNSGKLLVHFIGHGGRYIWRTGPSDIKENLDLFTLDHIETLAPSTRLPVVVSLTCYSAPFDHPSSDSIGEKFLRTPGRGAVAVIAASWRSSPSVLLSEAMVKELTTPGTIGDAFVRAKQQLRMESNIRLYNLLGDPALPLALPDLRLELTRDPSGKVKIKIPGKGFKGEILVEWLDDRGEPVHAINRRVRRQTLTVAPGQPVPEARMVRAYVWSKKAGIDGIGGIEFAAPAEPPPPPDSKAEPGKDAAG